MDKMVIVFEAHPYMNLNFAKVLREDTKFRIVHVGRAVNAQGTRIVEGKTLKSTMCLFNVKDNLFTLSISRNLTLVNYSG